MVKFLLILLLGGLLAMILARSWLTSCIYEKSIGEGIAKITINRPERRNGFRPQTIKDLIRAFNDARDDVSIGVVILTGKGTKAFCSGGDQALRGKQGYADVENFGQTRLCGSNCWLKKKTKQP